MDTRNQPADMKELAANIQNPMETVMSLTKHKNCLVSSVHGTKLNKSSSNLKVFSPLKISYIHYRASVKDFRLDCFCLSCISEIIHTCSVMTLTLLEIIIPVNKSNRPILTIRKISLQDIRKITWFSNLIKEYTIQKIKMSHNLKLA